MSALAASGAALESFRRPQQPRRREEVRRREREWRCGDVAAKESSRSCSLPRGDAARKKYLSKITRMLDLIKGF